MIQDVINNITSAENEAEDIIRIASLKAKDIRFSAESMVEGIVKQSTEDCKSASKLRATNAEVAANKKAEQIFKDGQKEIIDFTDKCRKNSDEAVKVITDKLVGKYVNR